MTKKFDCFKCKWRGDVPGSAHISCKHPSLKRVTDNPLLGLMGVFASVGRVKPLMANSKELNIKGHPTGIRNGWFNFPFNFAPTWLLNCDGFEKEGNK